jgi:CHAT domain-containing protein/Tfp pilus assembly protein PilF
MMRGTVALLLLALVAPAEAKDLPMPKPTVAGREELNGLIRRCGAAGGLKGVADPRSGATILVVDDPAKLKAAVAADRAALTPELRDALIARVDGDRERTLVPLLRAVGEATVDERVRAFASFFEAVRIQRHKGAAAAVLFEEAANRFQAGGEPAWQATSLGQLGLIRYAQGDWTRAMECSKKALGLFRAAMGPRDPKVAACLHCIANVYFEQGEYARALASYQEALAIFREAVDPAVGHCYIGIGNVENQRGRYVRALDSYQKALDSFAAAPGENRPEVAACYHNIGAVSCSLRELDRALEFHHKALAIWLVDQEANALDIADCYVGIADVYSEQGESARALELYQRARAIRRERLGEGHPRVIQCDSLIASVYARRGDYIQAIGLYQKALATYREAPGDHRLDIAGCYNNLANVACKQGEHAQALEYHQKSLTIDRAVRGDHHPDVAEDYSNMAGVYAEQGEFVRAVESYQKAVAIYREMPGEDHPGLAGCYSGLASLVLNQGEPARALELHQRALAIRRKALGDRHPDVAADRNNIGITYHALGDLTRALESHYQALAIRIERGERQVDVATSLNNIAVILTEQGEFARALDHYQRALGIWREVFGERHPNVAMGYDNIALVSAQQGRVGPALESFDRALDALVEPTATPEPPGTAPTRLRALPITVRVLLRRGWLRQQAPGSDPAVSWRLALRDYREAADVLQRTRQRVLATDPSRVHLGEQATELFPRTIGVAALLAAAEHRPDRPLDALEAAERGAARVFLEGLGQARAPLLGRVDPETLKEEARLLARIRQLDDRIASEQAQPFERRDRAAVARLFDDRKRADDELKELAGRLEREYPQYAAWKYPRACTVAQARACLANDEVALHYVLGADASYLVVMTKTADPQDSGLAVHALAASSEIAELVSALSQTKVLEDLDSTKELGAKAYRMLLAPAAGAIRGRHLVIVPGGVLGLLPFELLVEPVGGDGRGAVGSRFLVEGHRIRYAPSLTALHLIRLWEPSRQQPRRSLWAMGDPVYHASDPRCTPAAERTAETRGAPEEGLGGPGRSGPPSGTFERLAFSGEEIVRLRRVMGAGPGEMCVGPDATEAAVKTLSDAGILGQYRYIHFATHGILGLADATPPSLVLSLAGEQHGEDGFLTLGEVTGLRLNADLVVLSACQTGQGRLYNAEGVSGLARAFLYAGSRGVLCSLWRVDDEATAGLMTDIYAGLKAQKPAADALREAQLRMIADGQPPLYWAPFILIGQ